MSDIQNFANEIRKLIMRMVYLGKSSHVASALSMTDIVAVLYDSILQVRVDDPKWAARDRFILSKGHAGAAIYATLALKGFFPIEEAERHCQNGSIFSGHISHKGIPGIEASTGSLGHGLSIGAGMAYAAKCASKSHRIFVLLSDGECDEGSNWEAILFAAHHQLNNLTVIIDYNNLQSFQSVKETLNLEPFVDKWRSFGWYTSEVDGHDHQVLHDVLKDSLQAPHCVIAHTCKGKGVSFMENKVEWHYRSPSTEEYLLAIKELETPLVEIYENSAD